MHGPFFEIISGPVKEGDYSIFENDGEELWRDYKDLHVYEKTNFLARYRSFKSKRKKKQKELQDGYSSDHSVMFHRSFTPSTPPVKKMFRPIEPSTPSRQHLDAASPLAGGKRRKRRVAAAAFPSTLPSAGPQPTSTAAAAALPSTLPSAGHPPTSTADAAALPSALPSIPRHIGGVVGSKSLASSWRYLGTSFGC